MVSFVLPFMELFDEAFKMETLTDFKKKCHEFGLTFPLYQFEKKCWALIKKNDPCFTITLRPCWIALQERNGCNHVVDLFSGSSLTVAPGRTKKIILASISLDPVV